MTTQGISLTGVPVSGPGSGTADPPRTKVAALNLRSRVLSRHPAVSAVATDIAFVVIAILDVWLVVPEEAPSYSIYLSAASCAALLLRRKLPFTAVVLAVPGFFVGWAQLAAMFALGSLASRKPFHWHMWTGAGLVWLCRFVLWPPADFLGLTWRMHILDAIYGVIVAGMPVAIGLLIVSRAELADRLSELAASRDRERQLHAQAVRAEERARLAREMHDVVSHDITLIAMQAGVLSAAEAGTEAKKTADTIRTLSTRTLEELRGLVGVLRSGADMAVQADLRDLDDLVCHAGVPVRVTVENVPACLPAPVSAAAYRTVQEGLTNVRKHAPGATAFVHVSATGNSVCVDVHNDRPKSRRTVALPRGGGYGLAGLAERAKLLGGTFEAEPTDDGGFRIHARYPFG
ncbi:sensor histidine kinase [Saccharomonospora xinjiangensis]|uniref:histidine kinase n=1 Tax=Saccharomonospora xinjiangensis XJ-54 TaxID=882086 RepID=I0UXC3_9PSEU|nr:histidine kinase [Saccharomonospora xinjiangensis]EID52526.1 signal transduction histidine kinase [Saccharomonospora xinjiangensis XJ-54]